MGQGRARWTMAPGIAGTTSLFAELCNAVHSLQLDRQAGDGGGKAPSQSRGAQQLCVEGIVVSFWRSMFHPFF